MYFLLYKYRIFHLIIFFNMTYCVEMKWTMALLCQTQEQMQDWIMFPLTKNAYLLGWR